ncbi:hypothetical protein D9758_012957 [Tetrapyrgos nigripes]|uniref:Uncharacterized protein n=1 Tax=Tetrapyrgos nigripes TaxID=182062 RepID=A0A8H5FNC9_9AGAR|nr:hypothetical protein D9758_012957 [Tetrapyrgos nigripes]
MYSLIHRLLYLIGHDSMSDEEETEQPTPVPTGEESSNAQPAEAVAAADQEQLEKERGAANVMNKPASIALPTMPLTTDIQFHSPSSGIIGTPFQVNDAPYEYPFPSQSTANTRSPSSSTSSESIPTLGTTSSSTSPILPSSSTYLPPATSFSLSYTHPKLRQMSPPPIPPTLVKKSHRWSMRMLRRRNSQSTTSTTSDRSTNTTTPDVDEGRRYLVDVSRHVPIDPEQVPPTSSDPPGPTTTE